MRGKLWIAVIIVGVLCTGRCHAAMRLALISTGSEKQTGPIIALAEARLSGDSRLELLDRNTIGKILAEQKLSLSGLVDPAQAAAVGKLLRVEAFAVLESLGDNEPPDLVVFDGSSGARLVDVELPRNDAQADVEEIARGVDKAREKLAAIAGGMHGRTICLLAVRNADLPRQMDGMCDAVAMLLQRRLLASDDICLLERKRLEAINQERTLPTSRPGGAILASVVCVELEFSRAQDGVGITATAILSDATGKVLAKPLAHVEKEDADDAVKLAKGLSASISDALQIIPPAQEANAHQEAERFEREARFLLGHQEVEQASQAAQAAYAIEPDSARYSSLAAVALLRRAEQLSRTDGHDVEALKMAASAIEIRDRRLELLAKNNPADSQLRISPDQPTGDQLALLFNRAYAPHLNADSNIAAAADELGQVYLRFIDHWLALSEAASAGDARLLRQDMENIRLNRVLTVMALASRDPSEYLQEASGVYGRYFALIGKLDRSSALPLYLAAGHDLSATDPRGVSQKSWRQAQWVPSDLQRMDDLFSPLEKNDQPAIRFYGFRGRLVFEKMLAQPAASDCQGLYDKARQAARDAMGDADFLAMDPRGSFRSQLYNEAVNLLDILRSPDHPTLAERMDWYDFIYSRHEIPFGAVADLHWLGHVQASDTQVADFLGKLAAAVNSSQTQFISCSREEARAKLADQIQALRVMRPELNPAGKDAAPVKLKALLTASDDTGIITVDQILMSKDAVFAVVSVFGDDGFQYKALRVPLDGGNPESLGSIAGNGAVNDACIDEARLFVATDKGILIYPLHGGAVTRLTQADGLPTGAVQSLAVANGVIYAGLNDDGYLIAYDLKAQHCQVLASSRRKEKLSPFDDTDGFTIPRLIADPSGGVILAAKFSSGRQPQSGLWAFDPHSEQFKQLVKVYDFTGLAAGAGRILPDGRIAVFSPTWALAYDPHDGVSQVLFCSNKIGPDISGEPSLFHFNRQLAGPFCLIGSELWAGKPLCRIDAKTNKVQAIALPSTEQSGGASWIEPVPGGQQVLVGNARGVWLVSPSPAASSQPAAR